MKSKSGAKVDGERAESLKKTNTPLASKLICGFFVSVLLVLCVADPRWLLLETLTFLVALVLCGAGVIASGSILNRLDDRTGRSWPSKLVIAVWTSVCLSALQALSRNYF